MKSSVAPEKEAIPVEIFLRVKHPTMDPAEITEALGIEPEHAVHVGPAASKSGVRRLHSESYWLARLPTQSLLERVRMQSSATPHPLPTFVKGHVARLADATQYDWYILQALDLLQEKTEFLQQLGREGSIVLLIQRQDHTMPVSLRISLQRLTELGIALEID